MAFQNPERTINMMFGGTSEIISRHLVKILCRDVAAAAPMPKSSAHLKWMKTHITFDTTDYPNNMSRTGVLPLVAASTISNVRIRHVLIDGGTRLNVMSLHAFEALQIPMSKVKSSQPFGGMGNDPMWPYGHISLPVNFRTADNYMTEMIVFDVANIDLPFNAILGRSSLYRFMAASHYGYLILKITAANRVITIHTDYKAAEEDEEQDTSPRLRAFGRCCPDHRSEAHRQGALHARWKPHWSELDQTPRTPGRHQSYAHKDQPGLRRSLLHHPHRCGARGE
jgi:hypothetical protein